MSGDLLPFEPAPAELCDYCNPCFRGDPTGETLCTDCQAAVDELAELHGMEGAA